MPAAFSPDRRNEWPDLLVLGGGVLALAQGISAASVELVEAGAAVGLVGYAGRLRHPLTFWLYLASGLVFCGLGVLHSAAATGAPLNYQSLAELSAGAVLVGVGVFNFLRQREDDYENDEPLVSLVLLDREHRFLDRQILASIVNSAWGNERELSGELGREDEILVCGEGPSFVVETRLGRFAVNGFALSYWENCDEVVGHLSDIRAQRAIEAHGAWVSVDWIGPLPAEKHDLVYRLIGSLVADLAAPSTLALFHPESGGFRVWEPSLLEALRSSRPLDAFATGNSAPVVQVSPDDPEMKAAVEEARRRWPEFVAHFQRRHPEQHFSVKAPISRDGATEHIWIEVLSITAEQVRGRLGNDPIDLGNLKIGDPINVAIESIEDWLYVLTDEPVGGFTIPAVTSASRRTRKAE
jgi:uncharacterized protein YegJ (DUF2314 family)